MAHTCEGCGKAIKPIFKVSSNPETWFYLTCDTCLEEYCDKCAECDEQGKVQCNGCYENSLHQKCL
jgi:hypothetical protein